jgi:glycosyltransferase involved in cell wall biosynthesis
MRLATFTEQRFFGGGEKALANLLEGLDPAIDVTVVGANREVVEKIANARPGCGTRVVRRVAGRRDAAGILEQFRVIRELRPDILHANGNAWSGQYALLTASFLRHTATVAAHHSLTPADTRSQVWLNRRKLRRVDRNVAVSRFVARGVEEIARLPPGAVRVIHNGVPDAATSARPRLAPGPTIGSVGRLSPEKGQDVFVRALRDLPDVTGVLIGDGPSRGALEALADRIGVAQRLIVTGWQEDPRPWLAALDVFVLPSRLEGLPLAAIEAMLASRAVVASDVGGLPEVVVDGQTGFLVPPGDAAALVATLRSLLADPSRAQKMGRRGREVALRRFGLSQMVAGYEALYQELLERL